MPRRTPLATGELALLGSAIVATASALALAVVDPAGWARAGREDGLVETAGALAFLLLSVVAAIRAVRSAPGARAPSLAAVFIGVIGAGEEISWGQRLLGTEPPEFFATHNVQGELNLHNLIHPPWDGILAVAVFLGFCLSPWLRARGWVRKLVDHGVPWPRPVHVAVLAGCSVAGLAVASITDVGDLEEVGELLFVLVVAAVWSSRCGQPRAP